MSRLSARHDAMDMDMDSDAKGPWSPTAEESQASMDAWLGTAKYSRDVSYLLIALALCAAAIGAVRRLRHRGVRAERRVSQLLYSIPGSLRILALIRVLTYRTLRPSKYWSSPSYASLLLSLAFSATLTGICFGFHPYYWRNRKIGSPPLAVRSGMMATALFPWFYGLALKVNPFTWLTGVSHEKLQVYHQWMARLMLFLSWVHTIPFLWQPGHDAAPQTLKDSYDGDRLTWNTGIAALVLMTWMTLTSTSFVRRLGYEFFVLQHLLCTLGVLGLMFVHTGDSIGSWSYLWATVAVWGASTLIKWSRMMIGSTFGCRFEATIEAVDPSVSSPHVEASAAPSSASDTSSALSTGEDNPQVKVLRIALKTPLQWSAGQHVFLRFPALQPLTSHPWTICSLARNDQNENMMVFVATVREGQTKTLYDMVCGESRYGEVAERMGLLSHLSDDDDFAGNDPSRPSAHPPSRHGSNNHQHKAETPPVWEKSHGPEESISEQSEEGDLHHAPVLGKSQGVAEEGDCYDRICASRVARPSPTRTIVLPVIVDGPYGASTRVAQFPSVLLLAGGVGITRIVSAILEAVRTVQLAQESGKRVPLQRLHLVWAAGQAKLLPWFGTTLRAALAGLEAAGVEVIADLHLSSEQVCGRALHGAGPQPGWRVIGARADIRKIVRDTVDEAETLGHGVVHISVCGAKGFNYEASSAASCLNWELLGGRRRGSVREVILDAEHFAF